MTTETIDPAKAAAFAGQLIGSLNGAMSMLLVSVGNRLELFDKLAAMPPSTPDQIAKNTGLNERYVREWLGGMTTAHIMEHDDASGTYWLPAEHAASLTRAAGPGNLGNFAEFVSLMGNVEDQIVNCFQRGGGVPYSAFPKFQSLMAKLSAEVFDLALIERTLPLVPGIGARLERGIDVADIGCGAGHAINLMARTYPNSRFLGFDFSKEGVGLGRAEAKSLGLSNASFEVQDVSALNRPGQFDLITAFDTIHDQAQPRKVLRQVHDALRPGGTFLMVDVAADSTHAGNMEHPLAPAMYTISTFHCMTVSLALDGEGLGTMWGEQKARELLREAGFPDVTIEHVEGDIENSYYICPRR